MSGGGGKLLQLLGLLPVTYGATMSRVQVHACTSAYGTVSLCLIRGAAAKWAEGKEAAARPFFRSK